MGDKQWYTNKDLFELINELKLDLQETRQMIRQYNGLREELADVEKRLSDMESRAKGRNSVGKAIREWGGWVFALITLLVLLFIG